MPRGKPIVKLQKGRKALKELHSQVDNHIITVFVVIAAVAIVVQMGVLLALYMALRRTSERMEGIAGRLEQQATPVLASAAAILEDAKPKIADITTNLAETSTALRTHVGHVGHAASEIAERARMQAARLDDFVISAAHKVEATSELLQDKVLSPMRRVRSIVTALNAGLSFFKSNRPRHRKSSGEVEDEEMFI
jgi:methyl-accepting chemotaxis protein